MAGLATDRGGGCARVRSVVETGEESCARVKCGDSVGLGVMAEVKGLEKRVPISNKYTCRRRRCRVRCVVQRRRRSGACRD
jgi:hypothetical protein